jgi:hypothetical protein
MLNPNHYLSNGWIDVKERAPDVGIFVRALLRGCSKGTIVEALLYHVDEDDCFWRTADDNSEVSYDWDVLYWKP